MKEWALANPGLAMLAALFVFALAVSVLKLMMGDGGSDSGGIGPTVEEDDKPEMTCITILASDGKVIEEFTALRGSLIWDDDNLPSIRFDTKEKEDIVYLLGTFSVKMVDL